MDIGEDVRGPDEDEALLEFFLPAVKSDGDCDQRCYTPRQRPDSRGSESGSTRANERVSPTQAPSPLEPSVSPQPAAYQEAEHFPFDPFEYPENEVARSKMISDALQQEDEFLAYLMSLPISHKFSEVVDEKHDHCDLRLENSGNLGAGIGESDDPTPHAIPTVSKVGLDHLDNLCKLMEQLGELRDQNSKLQRRVQYLEDLKSLHDMHKQLQESLDSKRKLERRVSREAGDKQGDGHISPRVTGQTGFAENPLETGDSLLVVKRHASEESVLHGGSPVAGGGGDSKGSSTKRKGHHRSRQTFLRQQYRERSRSVGHEEVGEAVREAIKNPRKSVNLQWQRPRRGYVKSKVSKWTKVKEAFRWEKAQLDGCSQRNETGDFTSGLPESKSQDSGIGLGQRQVSEDRPHSDEGANPSQCFLRVFPGKEGEPSASPSDSVLGGSSSPYHAYSYALSSSSSSSDDLMEIDLNLSSISEAIDMGPQRSASATDSTADKLVQQEGSSEQRGRRSLSQGQEEDAARRSKSLDCEDIQRPYATFVLDDKSGSISKKAHRTPWGKVKDIIQTRRDSVKKRQKEEGKRDDGAAKADAEHAVPPCDQEEDGDRSGCESAEDEGVRWHQRTEESRGDDKRKGYRTASPPPPSSPRRLTPTLTVTLPSTEELTGPGERGGGAGEEYRLWQGDGREDRSRGHSDCEEPDVQGIHQRKDGQFAQFGDAALEAAGTSPPAPRRPSKWTKVKKAFLTARKEVEGTARGAGAVAADHSLGAGRLPCSECNARRLTDRSTVNHGLRIYLEGCGSPGAGRDTERLLNTRGRREGLEAPSCHTTAPPSPAADSCGPRTISPTTQRDIQKNYDELQQKLSQEFHKKLNEWERMKGGWCTTHEVKGEECEDLRKKNYDWEKNKDKSSGRVAAPADESHLPIDFRKRLTEWKRVRAAASEARPEAMAGRGRGVPGGVARGSVISDDESLPPQFRKRLVEWQLWRAVTGKSDQNVEELHKILPEEFYRKLQEWERIKAEAVVPVRVGSGRRYGRRDTGGGLVMRKDASALGRVVRRMRANEVVLGERWRQQRSEVAREAKHRGKEVQWLEKELQKVEREKLRLEREREKYLEREARLERMRKAMGQRPPGKQEVLIQTSTGFFRFQGISEKFTRKLYEWEKQRGIGPEASTFALLDPTYRPTAPSTVSAEAAGDSTLDALRSSSCIPGTPSSALPRSRSEGSLTESGAASGGPVHSRSSSLGHVDAKERSRSMEQEVPSRASSEPRMRSEARALLVGEETEEEDDDEEETAALLVEVEDVEEETAAALEELPTLPSETPIYSYAPEEVTRLIDSSGSESEKDSKCYGEASINRSSSVRTQSSYELIEENMTLINKLKMKENICRELENEIEDLEGKIQDIAKTHQEELERLRREETGLEEKSNEQSSVAEEAESCSGSIYGSSHGEMVARLKLRVNELERCQEQLKQEEENLQTSFQVHSEQQEALAQNLVGKMKLLQEVSKVVGGQEDNWIEGNMGEKEDSSSINKRLEADLNDSHSIAVVQDLSTELLQLAEKLELTLADRNQEIRNLRFELQDRKKIGHGEENKSAVFRSGQARNWSSAEGVHLSAEENLVPLSDSRMAKFTKTMIPRQSSEELAELPFLLTSKVLELKKELSNLCNTKDSKMIYQRYQPCRGKLQRIPNFQAEDEDSDTELKRNISEKDNSASRRSEHGASDRISYRPPPRPQAGADEVREWTSRRPNSTRYSSGFEGKGTPEAEGASSEQGATSRGKSTMAEPEISKTGGTERSRSLRTPSSADRKDETRRWKEEGASVEEGGGERCIGGPRTGRGVDEGTKGCFEEESAVKGRENMLKTRRISDTHITYDSTRPSKVQRMGTRELPPPSSAAVHAALKDHENLIAEGVTGGGRWTGDTIRLPTSNDPDQTTPNVFVQTTRKIFSPVCGSSKGSDASNVIGYVEEFLEEGGGAGGEVGTPPWRRKSGALPPMERTPSRPHRPLGDPPRGGGDGSGRAMPRSEHSPAPPCAHPLPPPSPLSGRRDKAKEAAPSIRLMIAKYDLKQQQEGGSDGRSPESRSSGGRSPAWLSPTADRRDLFGMGGVRAQMEKYQEEVRKALMGYSTSETATVQKSASAGIIRSLGIGACLKPPLHSIAKSSSAGAIKSGREEVGAGPAPGEQNGSPAANLFHNEDRRTEDGSLQMNDSIEKTLKMLRERHPSPPPSPSRSHKFAHVRAMRLKKAKEEFMRNTNAGAAPAEEESHTKFHSVTRSANSSAKEEGDVGGRGMVDAEEGAGGEEDGVEGKGAKIGMDANAEVKENKVSGVAMGGGDGEGEGATGGADQGVVSRGGGGGIDARSRHSQISFGSDSSYEDSSTAQEGLIKSASSGMIDIYSQKCRQTPMAKVSEREGDNEDISSSHSSKCLTSASEVADGQGTSKLGILSRFRRVKLRTKKMSAISALCRQSLLVSVEKEGGEREEGEGEGVGKRRAVGEGGKQKSKSTPGYSVPLCRSCPSSPVPSSKKPENSGCWIHNPKHVFKTQRDRDENFPKMNVGVSFPSKS